MRFRTGLLLGIAIGYVIGQRASEGGEVPGPAAGTTDLAARSRRLLDQAARVAADALSRARSQIRGRPGGPGEADWN